MAALAADLGVGRTVDTFVGERYVTPTATAVKRILAEASEGDDQPSACELIEALIAEHGWSAVRREMLELLRTYERPEDWHTAAQVLWGAVLDGREIDANEAIAHLYLRLPRDGDVASSDDRDNLAWSIRLQAEAQSLPFGV